LFDIDGSVRHESVPPGQCYCASFAEEAARQVAGRDSGFCITITHRATHLLLCHHPTTALSGSRSEGILAVAYAENGPHGDTIRNHGEHKIKTLQPNSRRLKKKSSTGFFKKW
jgi:hypothetical protein